jgi:DtxR family Mn-dependent transcriptional regulator
VALPSLTVENYVKAVYQICSAQAGAPAATGQLAAALGVSPSTVTSMVKTLSESGLLTYTPYEGVQLTPAGRTLALRVLRRHRLIELFLARTLGLSWDEVHDEAENMEHAVSDWLVDRIDEFLGFPQHDPHGDPIPRSDGSLTSVDTKTLGQCASGESFRVVRVLDQSPEFLRYLGEAGLTPEARGRVTISQPEAGTLTVAMGDRDTTLALEAAAKILVARGGS